MKLFVVVLRYVVESDKVQETRLPHLDFVQKGYEDGVFLLSGPLSPRAGGVIFAQSISRESLLDFLSEDPFAQNGVAEFSVYEFKPSRHHVELEFFGKYM